MTPPSAAKSSTPVAPIHTAPIVTYMQRKWKDLQIEQPDICWRPSNDWRNVCIKPLAHHGQCGWDEVEQVGWCDPSEPGVPIVRPMDPPGVVSAHRLGAPRWQPVFRLRRDRIGDAGAHRATSGEVGP